MYKKIYALLFALLFAVPPSQAHQTEDVFYDEQGIELNFEDLNLQYDTELVEFEYYLEHEASPEIQALAIGIVVDLVIMHDFFIRYIDRVLNEDLAQFLTSTDYSLEEMKDLFNGVEDILYGSKSLFSMLLRQRRTINQDYFSDSSISLYKLSHDTELLFAFFDCVMSQLSENEFEVISKTFFNPYERQMVKNKVLNDYELLSPAAQLCIKNSLQRFYLSSPEVKERMYSYFNNSLRLIETSNEKVVGLFIEKRSQEIVQNYAKAFESVLVEYPEIKKLEGKFDEHEELDLQFLATFGNMCIKRCIEANNFMLAALAQQS